MFQLTEAVFQWQICADGNNHRPLCAACAVALNRMVLLWMKHPQADVLANRYANDKMRRGPTTEGETK